MDLNNLLVMLTAILIGSSCSLLGSFLILRKSVMIGDAISHSVLPGIVLAFIFTEERAAFPILIGAAVFGVLTTMFIQFLQRRSNVQEGAAIGISFTFFFALGVIMIALSTGGNVDIDQECVLFGEIASSYLDKIFIDGYFVGTRSILTMTPVLVIIILFVILGMKGLRLTSFNEDYAKALGINVNAWNYALLMLVSITAVLSFEAVGAVLVVGFLTIPPASAYLITNNLSKMLWISVLYTILAAVGGTLLALELDVTISGMIVSVSGILFLITWLIQILVQKRNKIESLKSV
ncbi:metal ABC transporter permease [Lishizhenia sp.]|uniref:metal ABC transporter permease n=1 Tax=Lishizhenia sp. TaxID=2497594 RepID=UPI00299DF8C0|nr:metal ABC transporter permease [Lishizhenia sp.]MDX1444968.1 metal ABC transporter permease [Lishizhenia sp.]